MKLLIYTLNNCKVCAARTEAHNQLAEMLSGMDVEVLGVQFGEIDGVRYVPYDQHDQFCRKPNDPMKYTAPVYILESDDAVIGLEDFSKYRTADRYAEYIASMIAQLDSQ